VIGAPCTDGDHIYNIVSGVDHPGSDSVGLLTMMIRGNIRGTSIVAQVPCDSVNPAKKLISQIDHIHV
jgi:hypothetical protein